jgi:apolipoprotein N-acyltransferase
MRDSSFRQQHMKATNFLKKLAQITLALGLGTFAVLAMPPYHIITALFVSVGGFFLLYNYPKSNAFTFLLSAAYFYGYFQASLLWWSAPFFKPGQDISIYIIAGVSLAPVVFALQHGLALTLAKMIPIKQTGQIFIFAAAWSMCTWFCSTIAPRVPASPIGYAWDFNLPSLQILSVIGIYGLTFLTILIACVPALFFLRDSKRVQLSLAASLTILAVLIYYGGIIRYLMSLLNLWQTYKYD